MKPRILTLEIALISFAALLLEVSYTRIFSFKASMHFTYLIIGLGLLGIGAGAVSVAVFGRLRQISTERLLAVVTLASGLASGLGYYVIAATELSTYAFPPSPSELLGLGVASATLFASFLGAGLMIATLFSSRPDSIPRLYFADLLGAGLGCAAAVPLMLALSPPGCVFVASAVFALAGIRPALLVDNRGLAAVCGLVAAALALVAGVPRAQPELVLDPMKSLPILLEQDLRVAYSRWHPTFRVDVVEAENAPNFKLLVHDGMAGSSLQRYDGTGAGLDFIPTSNRRQALDLAPPDPNVLIVGSAGGRDVLISLMLGARHITGLELNPVTVSLLERVFADFTGRLPDHESITIINTEARSHLRRDDSLYDLVYFGAPDSYAAMNAAQASGFVLVESYLYTVEMLVDALRHLSPEGIVAIQFGELNYAATPNRSARYVATARRALAELGVRDFGRHILLATNKDFPLDTTTVVLRTTPFTEVQVDAFYEATARLTDGVVRHPSRDTPDDSVPARVVRASDAELAQLLDSYPYEIGPITDDRPFFWHFTPFSALLGTTLFEKRVIDTEGGMGEATLLTMLGVAALFAASFLLLPFVAIRGTWRELPHKGIGCVYFACLGLGFMFFEIAMMQKLTLFLGYPTYSLSVTLFSLLVFAGIGSFATERSQARIRTAMPWLIACVALLAIFYMFPLDSIVERLVGLALPLRVGIAALLLLPLGLVLGTFMPIGLSLVSRLTRHRSEYVAWGWAVNGFFSVMGSILATILSMTYGFRFLLFLALLLYVLAGLSLTRLAPHAGSDASGA